ncbi:amino acid ABC transporter substrate-binding protein [Xenophilus sp. Marseille-Q4582]|uniref:amino acid ABC transporter substrate-binding protein n=1 Tax=Xenophilus sp. Marseille-Q4582 TaxID=2866600 RepID=UPI001CE410A1|nr:amino acid ABC transporter substrate-binding protein [Xenophilus sp. Marseille-Q4582]
MKTTAAIAASIVALSITTFAEAQSSPSTIEKAKSSGVFTIGYREASIPFSYLGTNGQPTGFGFEICNRIADEVKRLTGRSDLIVKTQAVTPQNRIALIQNGSVDVECGSTTNNADRNKQVAFAINYFYTGTRLLVKADSPVRSLQDLKGRKVVSTTGTTNMLVIRKAARDQNLDVNLIAAKDHGESALLVESGRADAFAMDDILLYGIKAIDPASMNLTQAA